LNARFEPTGQIGDIPGLIPALERTSKAPVLVHLMRLRNQQAQRRIVRDCRMLSRLRPPGLIRILEVIEEGDLLTVIVDPVRGKTLSEAAATAALPLALVVQALTQLATPLDFLHGQDPTDLRRPAGALPHRADQR
jgi:serine/threonine protein kinase